jgi:hypothetical protein
MLFHSGALGSQAILQSQLEINQVGLSNCSNGTEFRVFNTFITLCVFTFPLKLTFSSPVQRIISFTCELVRFGFNFHTNEVNHETNGAAIEVQSKYEYTSKLSE